MLSRLMKKTRKKEEDPMNRADPAMMDVYALPESILPDRDLDGVLHRLLVGHATFMAQRPPIVDGGLLVMPYTSSIEAAARLFDARLAPEEWGMHRTGVSDIVWMPRLGQRALGISTGRGLGAMALSMLTLARIRDIHQSGDIGPMIAKTLALSTDVCARRLIDRL